MGNHFSEAELIQLATVERRSYTDLTPAHLASDLLDCRAEVVALREQVETLRGRFIRADDRVALLEAALRRTHSRLSLIRHRGGIRWDVPGELAAIGSEWECDEILGLAEAALLAGGGHA